MKKLKFSQDDDAGANPPNLSINGVSPRGMMRRMSGQNAGVHHGHSNSISVGHAGHAGLEGPMAHTQPSVIAQPGNVSPMRGANGMAHNLSVRGPNPGLAGNQLQPNALNSEFET